MAKAKALQRDKGKKSGSGASKSAASAGGTSKSTDKGSNGPGRMRNRKKSAPEVYKSRHNIGNRSAAGRVASYHETEVALLFPDGFFRQNVKSEIGEKGEKPGKSETEEVVVKSERVSEEKTGDDGGGSPDRSRSGGQPSPSRSSSRSLSPKHKGSETQKQLKKSTIKKEKLPPKKIKSEAMETNLTDQINSSISEKVSSNDTKKGVSKKDKAVKANVKGQKAAKDKGKQSKEQPKQDKDPPSPGPNKNAKDTATPKKTSADSKISGKRKNIEVKSPKSKKEPLSKKSKGASQNKDKSSPKSKFKGIMPRAPRIKRTACLNAGAIMSAMYKDEPVVKKPKIDDTKTSDIKTSPCKSESDKSSPELSPEAARLASGLGSPKTKESGKKSKLLKVAAKVASKKLKKAASQGSGKKAKVKMKGLTKKLDKVKVKKKAKKVEKVETESEEESSEEEEEKHEPLWPPPRRMASLNAQAILAATKDLEEKAKLDRAPRSPKKQTKKSEAEVSDSKPSESEMSSPEKDEKSPEKESSSEQDTESPIKSPEPQQTPESKPTENSLKSPAASSPSTLPVTQALPAASNSASPGSNHVSPNNQPGAVIRPTSRPSLTPPHQVKPGVPTPSPDLQILEVKPPAFGGPSGRNSAGVFTGAPHALSRGGQGSRPFMPSPGSSFNFAGVHSAQGRYGTPLQQTVPPHGGGYPIQHPDQRGFQSTHMGYQSQSQSQAHSQNLMRSHAPQKLYPPGHHQGVSQLPQGQGQGQSHGPYTVHQQSHGPQSMMPQSQAPFPQASQQAQQQQQQQQQSHHHQMGYQTPHSSQTSIPPHQSTQSYHQAYSMQQGPPRGPLSAAGHHPSYPGVPPTPSTKPKLEPPCCTPGPRFHPIGPKPEKPLSTFPQIGGNSTSGHLAGGHNNPHGSSPMGNTCTYPYPHSNNSNSSMQSDQCQAYMMSSVPVDNTTYTMMSFRHFGNTFALHSFEDQQAQQHATLGFYQPAGPLIQTVPPHDPCCMPDHMAMLVPRPQVKVLVHNTGSYPPKPYPAAGAMPLPQPTTDKPQAIRPAPDKPQPIKESSPKPKDKEKDKEKPKETSSPLKKTKEGKETKEKEKKETKDSEGKVFTTLEVAKKPAKNVNGRELLAQHVQMSDVAGVLQPGLAQPLHGGQVTKEVARTLATGSAPSLNRIIDSHQTVVTSTITSATISGKSDVNSKSSGVESLVTRSSKPVDTSVSVSPSVLSTATVTSTAVVTPEAPAKKDAKKETPKGKSKKREKSERNKDTKTDTEKSAESQSDTESKIKSPDTTVKSTDNKSANPKTKTTDKTKTGDNKAKSMDKTKSDIKTKSSENTTTSADSKKGSDATIPTVSSSPVSTVTNSITSTICTTSTMASPTNVASEKPNSKAKQMGKSSANVKSVEPVSTSTTVTTATSSVSMTTAVSSVASGAVSTSVSSSVSMTKSTGTTTPKSSKKAKTAITPTAVVTATASSNSTTSTVTMVTKSTSTGTKSTSGRKRKSAAHEEQGNIPAVVSQASSSVPTTTTNVITKSKTTAKTPKRAKLSTKSSTTTTSTTTAAVTTTTTSSTSVVSSTAKSPKSKAETILSTAPNSTTASSVKGTQSTTSVVNSKPTKAKKNALTTTVASGKGSPIVVPSTAKLVKGASTTVSTASTDGNKVTPQSSVATSIQVTSSALPSTVVPSTIAIPLYTTQTSTPVQALTLPNTKVSITPSVKLSESKPGTAQILPQGAVLLPGSSSVSQPVFMGSLPTITGQMSSHIPMVTMQAGQIVTPVFLQASSASSTSVSPSTAVTSTGLSSIPSNLLTTVTNAARMPYMSGQFQVTQQGNLAISNMLPPVFLSLSQANAMGQTFLQLGPRPGVQQLTVPMVTPQQLLVTQGTQVITKPVQGAGQMNKPVPIQAAIKAPVKPKENTEVKSGTEDKTKTPKTKTVIKKKAEFTRADGGAPLIPKRKPNKKKKKSLEESKPVAESTGNQDSSTTKKSSNSAKSKETVSKAVSNETSTKTAADAMATIAQLVGKPSPLPASVVATKAITTSSLGSGKAETKSSPSIHPAFDLKGQNPLEMLQTVARKIQLESQAAAAQQVLAHQVVAAQQAVVQQAVAQQAAVQQVLQAAHSPRPLVTPPRQSRQVRSSSTGSMEKQPTQLDPSGALNLVMPSTSPITASTSVSPKGKKSKGKKSSTVRSLSMGSPTGLNHPKSAASNAGMTSPRPLQQLQSPVSAHSKPAFSPNPGLAARTPVTNTTSGSYEDLIQDLSMPRGITTPSKGGKKSDPSTPIDLSKSKGQKSPKKPPVITDRAKPSKPPKSPPVSLSVPQVSSPVILSPKTQTEAKTVTASGVGQPVSIPVTIAQLMTSSSIVHPKPQLMSFASTTTTTASPLKPKPHSLPGKAPSITTPPKPVTDSTTPGKQLEQSKQPPKSTGSPRPTAFHLHLSQLAAATQLVSKPSGLAQAISRSVALKSATKPGSPISKPSKLDSPVGKLMKSVSPVNKPVTKSPVPAVSENMNRKNDENSDNKTPAIQSSKAATDAATQDKCQALETTQGKETDSESGSNRTSEIKATLDFIIQKTEDLKSVTDKSPAAASASSKDSDGAGGGEKVLIITTPPKEKPQTEGGKPVFHGYEKPTTPKGSKGFQINEVVQRLHLANKEATGLSDSDSDKKTEEETQPDVQSAPEVKETPDVEKTEVPRSNTDMDDCKISEKSSSALDSLHNSSDNVLPTCQTSESTKITAESISTPTDSESVPKLESTATTKPIPISDVSDTVLIVDVACEPVSESVPKSSESLPMEVDSVPVQDPVVSECSSSKPGTPSEPLETTKSTKEASELLPASDSASEPTETGTNELTPLEPTVAEIKVNSLNEESNISTKKSSVDTTSSSVVCTGEGSSSTEETTQVSTLADTGNVISGDNDLVRSETETKLLPKSTLPESSGSETETKSLPKPTENDCETLIENDKLTPGEIPLDTKIDSCMTNIDDDSRITLKIIEQDCELELESMNNSDNAVSQSILILNLPDQSGESSQEETSCPANQSDDCLLESSSKLEENNDDHAKTSKDIAQNNDDCLKTSKDIAQNNDDCLKTSKDIAQNNDDCSKTSEDIAQSNDVCAKTSGDIDQNDDDSAKTSIDIAQTLSEVDNTLVRSKDKHTECDSTEIDNLIGITSVDGDNHSTKQCVPSENVTVNNGDDRITNEYFLVSKPQSQQGIDDEHEEKHHSSSSLDLENGPTEEFPVAQTQEIMNIDSTLKDSDIVDSLLSIEDCVQESCLEKPDSDIIDDCSEPTVPNGRLVVSPGSSDQSHDSITPEINFISNSITEEIESEVVTFDDTLVLVEQAVSTVAENNIIIPSSLEVRAEKLAMVREAMHFDSGNGLLCVGTNFVDIGSENIPRKSPSPKLARNALSRRAKSPNVNKIFDSTLMNSWRKSPTIGKRSPTGKKDFSDDHPRKSPNAKRKEIPGSVEEITSRKSPKVDSPSKDHLQIPDSPNSGENPRKNSPGRRVPSGIKKLPEESPTRTSPRVQASTSSSSSSSSSAKKEELLIITAEEQLRKPSTSSKRKDDSPGASPPAKKALISPKKKDEKKSQEPKKPSATAKKPYIPWHWEGEPELKPVYVDVEGPPVLQSCYPAIRHDDGDVIRVRDCVLVKSGPRKSDLPYVAKIGILFEHSETKEMMMSVLWYYRAEHTDTDRLPEYIDCEVFASKHRDTIPAACIDDKCYVLTANEFCRYRAEQKRIVQGCPPRAEDIPMLDASEMPVNPDHIPPHTANPETVFLCRRVYDFKLKRILKNPQVHLAERNQNIVG